MADEQTKQVTTGAGDIAEYVWWENMGTNEETLKLRGIYVVAGHTLRVFVEFYTHAPRMCHAELSEYLSNLGWVQFAELPWAVMTHNARADDAIRRDRDRLIETFRRMLVALDRHWEGLRDADRTIVWDQLDDEVPV